MPPYLLTGGRPFLESLDIQVLSVKERAFATGTLKNRKTQIKTYLLFALYIGIQPFSLSVRNLVRYIVFLSRSLKAFSSIRNYIDGLRFYLTVNGFHFDTLYNDIQVQIVIKGLKRILDTNPVHTMPITNNLLLKIYTKLNSSDQFHITLWAAFLLAFYGFLRKSSLLPKSAQSFCKTKHLTRAAFMCTKNAIIVNVPWTKTLQNGEKPLQIPLLPIPGSPLCPVAAVKNMFKAVPAPPHSPAFVIFQNGNLTPITHTVFVNQLRQFISVCGDESHKYSGHSFRRGGCQFAASCQGVTLPMLMTHGDWKSSAIQQYLDNDLFTRLTVMRAMRNKIINTDE